MFGPRSLAQTQLFAGVALLFFTTVPGWAIEFDLDLDELEVSGIAEFRGGGAILDPVRSRFPVEVTLTEIWPSTAAASDELSIRFSLHNVGEISVFIPASRNYSQVLKSGVTQRRSASFGLLVTPVSGFIDERKPTLSVGGRAVGAAGVPGTLVEPKPGDVLHARMTARLFEHSQQIIQSWREESDTNIVTLRFQAHFMPSEVPDDNLVPVARHGSFTSANSIDLAVDLTR